MWSYRKLVREYGETRALELLQEQQGYGEFDPKVSHMTNERDTPYDDVHTEVPCPDFVPTVYIPIEVGVDLKQWREKKENT
jgi:hypothetical protein